MFSLLKKSSGNIKFGVARVDDEDCLEYCLDLMNDVRITLTVV